MGFPILVATVLSLSGSVLSMDGALEAASAQAPESLPYLGVGIGFRRDISRSVVEHVREFDCLELVCESFFNARKALLALKSLRPVIPHSLAMSVGSEMDPAYLARVKDIVDLCGNRWYSDHLCFTRADGAATGHLMTLPWNEESLEVVTRNVKEVMRLMGPNFALENISNPFVWPNSTMTEGEFLDEVLRRTGCLLLLDVENVRINAENHGYDPRKFIAGLPLERIVQVHVAGGVNPDGAFAFDTHNAPVSKGTWDLLAYLVEHHRPRATILEHDEDFPPMAQLVSEVRTARSIVGGPGH